MKKLLLIRTMAAICLAPCYSAMADLSSPCTESPNGVWIRKHHTYSDSSVQGCIDWLRDHLFGWDPDKDWIYISGNQGGTQDSSDGGSTETCFEHSWDWDADTGAHRHNYRGWRHGIGDFDWTDDADLCSWGWKTDDWIHKPWNHDWKYDSYNIEWNNVEPDIYLVQPVPVPGAVILCGIGLSLAGLKLRTGKKS